MNLDSNPNARWYSATEAWRDLIQNVYDSGKAASPRGMEIVEIVGNQVQVDMACPVVLDKRRKLNYRFMAAEAWWILTGRDDTASIGEYCKNILQFSDDGERFFGAYGPKIIDQISHPIRTLVEDPSSRQAVINIWRESPPKSKDIPCTLSVQWLIRDGLFHCIDTMRSNDVWLGFPYDVFNFSMLSAEILRLLKVFNPTQFEPIELGTLFLNAGSHHLYMRDFEKAKAIIEGPDEDYELKHQLIADAFEWPIQIELETLLEKNDVGLSPFFENFKKTLMINTNN